MAVCPLWRAMADPVSGAVGAKILAMREADGASQADFATRLGFDRNFLGRVERGLQNLTLATVARIANKLGLSVAELVADVPSDDDTIRMLDAVSKRRSAPVKPGGRPTKTQKPN